MKYNIKDFMKGQKLEEMMKQYAEENPGLTGEEIQYLKELVENAKEEEINKAIFENIHRAAERRWIRSSVVIIILGVVIGYAIHSWWPILIGVILILVLMCVLIYLSGKFLEKSAGIPMSEQEILNRFRFSNRQSESEEKDGKS